MIRWRPISLILFFAFSSHASAFEVDFSDQIKADSHFKASVNKFVAAVRKSVPKHGVTGAVCSEKKILQRLGSRLPEVDDVKGLQYYYNGEVFLFFKRDIPGRSTNLLYLGINIDKIFVGKRFVDIAKKEIEYIEKESVDLANRFSEKMMLYLIHREGDTSGPISDDENDFLQSKLSHLNHHLQECGYGKYGEYHKD